MSTNETFYETPPAIYELIPKVMADIGAVSKDRKNEQQKYSFRGIEDFYQAAHPAMIKHGVFCAPKVLSREVYRFEKTNDQGRVTTWVHVALEVEHRFYAGDGSHVEVTTWGEGLDNSDKATNKAMSGAMKYALIELFCVPTKDVEDADRESPEAGTQRVRPDVPRITEDIPLNGGKKLVSRDELGDQVIGDDHILPPADQRLTDKQCETLHERFRDSLPESMRSKEKAILHDWLAQKLILDENGNPSTKAILKSEYAKVGREAVAFAKGLQDA